MSFLIFFSYFTEWFCIILFICISILLLSSVSIWIDFIVGIFFVSICVYLFIYIFRFTNWWNILIYFALWILNGFFTNCFRIVQGLSIWLVFINDFGLFFNVLILHVRVLLHLLVVFVFLGFLFLRILNWAIFLRILIRVMFFII